MNDILEITRYQLRNVLRGRWIAVYGLVFLVLGDALLRLGGPDARALLSLVNLVLFVVPLVSLVFGAMYLYGAREFTELILAQPVRRGHLFAALFLGVAAPLALAVGAGISVPFLVHGVAQTGLGPAVVRLVLTAMLLSLVFTALAFSIALRVQDRARGLGIALLAWLTLAVLYDGLVLLFVTAFGARPLERPVLVLMLLNPIDLGRVLLVLQMDLAAFMGYTGAAFEHFFGTRLGTAVAASALLAWLALPLWRGARAFRNMDF